MKESWGLYATKVRESPMILQKGKEFLRHTTPHFRACCLEIVINLSKTRNLKVQARIDRRHGCHPLFCNIHTGMGLVWGGRVCGSEGNYHPYRNKKGKKNLGSFNNAERAIKTDGFQNRKFRGLSGKLAILVHQQFWHTLGWVFGTQRGIKTDGFQMASSGISKVGIVVHQKFLVHVWVFPGISDFLQRKFL